MKGLFTTSWDDGHPLDLRLAEILSRYRCKSTFYIPSTNVEGYPTLSAREIIELRRMGFEIGSHTLNHRYLTGLTSAAAAKQIEEGKRQLEQIVGTAINGFCYPGGKFSEEHVQMVRSAGFEYARTTANLHLATIADPYRLPVSVQCYPHQNYVFLRNFVRHGHWRQRIKALQIMLNNSSLIARLKATLDHVCDFGGVFHLWGHSWELEQFNGWELLESFLEYADERIPLQNRFANFEIAQLARKYKQPS